jgi:hypothetical protein
MTKKIKAYMGDTVLKNKCMSIFISLIISFFVVSTPVYAAAEDVVTVEEALNDMSNRFIFSTFGEDALRWYEHREITGDLTTYASSEINLLAPFNSNIYLPLAFAFSLLIMISLFLLLFYMSWILYSGVQKTQKSGDFLGKSWNKSFFFIKIALAIALVMPISYIKVSENQELQALITKLSPIGIGGEVPQFNAAQLLVFKVAGYSNKYGIEANERLHKLQPRTFPSLKFPDPDTKMFSTIHLIKFATCVLLDDAVSGNVTIHLNRIEGAYAGSMKLASCALSLRIGIDDTKIAKYPSVEAVLGDYEGVQKRIIEVSLQNMASDALKIAKNLLIDRARRMDNNNISQFVDYTRSGGQKENVNNWVARCDDIINLTVAKGYFTYQERLQYAYMGARCLSAKFSEMVLYPSDIPDLSYLADQNYLEGNYLELCSHNYAATQAPLSLTSVEEFDGEAKNVAESFTVSVEQKYLGIEQCLKKECSSISSADKTGLYACANAASLYNDIKDDEENLKHGFFAFGASIYKKFSNFSPISPKKLYNQFSIKSEAESTSMESDDDITLLLFTKGVDIEIDDKLQSELFEDRWWLRQNGNILSNESLSTVESQDFSLSESSILSFKYWKDTVYQSDPFGATRMMACIKHPMRIHEGYACGSVTEEYHQFGDRLFNDMIRFKIMMGIINSVQIKKLDKKKKQGGNGIKKGFTKAVESVLKGLVKVLPLSGTALAGGVGAIMQNTEDTLLGTDEFGNITSKKVGLIAYSDEALLVLVAVMGNEYSMATMGMLINFLLIISIVFKYVIPFLPYYFFLILLFNWAALIFQMLFIAPIWAVYIMDPKEGHTNALLKRGFGMFLVLFLKIPYLMLGTLIAWIMINTVGSRVFRLFNFDTVMNMEESESISGLVDLIAELGIFMVVIYIITGITLKSMLTFYDFATNWIKEGSRGVADVASGNNQNDGVNQTKNYLNKFI